MPESGIVLWRALGGAICILVMSFYSDMSQSPLHLVPFATSIVLVFGLPDADPAQPRAVIGGHVVSTLTGLAIALVFGKTPWAAAAAVGVSLAAMHYTRTMHPPAGIDALIVVHDQLGWTFLFVPVLSGSLLLVLFAALWLNFFLLRPKTWPNRWT